MADVPAARTKAVFEFKSATQPLIAVILKTADLVLLADALEAHLGDSPDFFEHEPVVIDLSQLPSDAAAAEIDFASLRTTLARHQTQPIAVRGGSEAQHAAARAAGLAIAAMPVAPPPPPSARPGADPAPQIVREVPVPAGGTLVMDRPLRSGQQVYARGGDVIVTDVVNVGAEVIADGHIHVYAPLRGKAIAGARGDTSARIFTTCMEAQLVAIAGVYRTAEVALPPELAGRAVQIQLADQTLVMRPITHLNK